MNATKCSTPGSKDGSRATHPSPKPRLAALGVACLLALLLVAWIKSTIWERLGRLDRSFAAIESESFFLGTHVREGLVRLNSMLLRYQLSGNPEEREAFTRLSRELRQRLESGRGHLSTGPEEELARELELAYGAYLDSTAELRERAVRGVRKDSVALVQEQIDAFSRTVLALADDLVGRQRTAMESFFSGSHTALSSLQGLLWFALLLLLLMIVAIAALSYHLIVAPLRVQLSESQSLVQRQEKLASLGVLAAGVAHEIRNPLTAIKFRLFSLKKALPTGLQEHEDLTTIGTELNRLERIVRDFLQFARPSEPVYEDLNTGELLQQICKLLHDELGSRGIALTVTDSPELRVRGDRQQLQQVLVNLIQNAAESITGPGTVKLSVRRGAARFSERMEPAVTLEIQDTGRGIPPEAEGRLFDPFYSTKDNGTGLGLSIAARIVEKHGGLIQYTTRAGTGTTFSVVLPGALAHET